MNKNSVFNRIVVKADGSQSERKTNTNSQRSSLPPPNKKSYEM